MTMLKESPLHQY